MWDLSFPMRDWTRIPCTARQILNYWTTREVPLFISRSVKMSIYWYILEATTGMRFWSHSSAPLPPACPSWGSCTKEGLTATLRLPGGSSLSVEEKPFPLDILPATPPHSATPASLLVPFFCWAVILRFHLAIKWLQNLGVEIEKRRSSFLPCLPSRM